MIETWLFFVEILKLIVLFALFPAQIAWGLITTSPRPSALIGVGIFIGVYGGLAVALDRGVRWLVAGHLATRRNRRRRRVSR